ncbi:MAG: DUF2911 domain-containing protein [Thermoanaerobaculia bacterium]|nr:MAG: DUF2911 domain-containing protein [Thermoanaerobaculia bacterium]
MTSRRFVFAAAVSAALLVPAFAAAQDLHPSRRPSPMGMARVTLGDAYVRVVYGRPYKRDRENIFGTKESGALVPFGEVWRTGANEATEITVTRDVRVAGTKLAAGTYSLFTTPGAESWKIHFNSALGLDGTGYFDREAMKFTPADLPATEVMSVEVRSSTLPEDKEVDQLTIDFEKTEGGADLVLRWIRTEVRVPIALAD